MPKTNLSLGHQKIGIKKIDQLLTNGYLTPTEAKREKKLRLIKQAKLIQLMGNLLNSGFNLGEVINFLSLSKLVEKEFTLKMKEGLASGQALSELLESLSFSKNVVTQLALVEVHGNLSGTMQLVELHLKKTA